MAEVRFDLKFDSGGFQQVLAASRGLVDSTADGIVARTDGLAYRRSLTGTASKYGPRPIAVVFAHGSRNPLVQMATNRRLEGAM